MKEKIATSEWKVMEVLWRVPNSLAHVIIEELQGSGWSDKTIKTLLARLVKKGLVQYTKEGKAYRYYPVVTREECIEQESHEFVERVFGGSGKAFMTSFLKTEKLSRKEIEEIRSLLDEKGEQ